MLIGAIRESRRKISMCHCLSRRRQVENQGLLPEKSFDMGGIILALARFMVTVASCRLRRASIRHYVWKSPQRKSWKIFASISKRKQQLKTFGKC